MLQIIFKNVKWQFKKRKTLVYYYKKHLILIYEKLET